MAVSKGLIGKDDFTLWDGKTSTFTRKSSSGRHLTLQKADWMGVDVLQVFGGGTERTDATITDALTSIGTTNKVSIFLSPGSWVIDENVDWSSYTNVFFNIPPGAILSHGAYTVNIPNPTAGLYQIFNGSGTVTVSSISKTVYPEWWGDNTTPGTTDMTAEINAAIASLSNYDGTVKFHSTIYAISTTLVFQNAESPILLEGSGSYESSKGTVIKWIGGNSDSMIDMVSYVCLDNMFIYNGNSATSLIGLDFLGVSGTAVTHNVLNKVHVKSCAVGYAFNYAYYTSLNDCISSYNTIGYDLRTEANNINFVSCHSDHDATAITNANGTGARQVHWSGGSIENATTYGISLSQNNSTAWKFTNTYFESNYQHLLAGYVSITDFFMNHDGGSGTRQPFDIAGSRAITIISGGTSTDITDLFTISGSASSYTDKGIYIEDRYNKAALLASFQTLLDDWVATGYFDPKCFNFLETPFQDASGAVSTKILTIGNGWVGGKTPTIVAAYVVVETAVVVTGGSFTVTVANNVPTTYATYEFTDDVAVGIHALTLSATAMAPASQSYTVTGTAETSGSYKVVLICI